VYHGVHVQGCSCPRVTPGSHGAIDADERCHVTVPGQLVDESIITRRQIHRRPPSTPLPLRQQHVFDAHDVHMGQCRRLSSDCAHVEDWHGRLNTITRRGHLPLYQLPQLLFDEGPRRRRRCCQKASSTVCDDDSIIIMVALWNRAAIIFLPCGFYLLLLSFFLA